MVFLRLLLLVLFAERSQCFKPEPGGSVFMMPFDLKLGEQLNAAFWQQNGVDALKNRFKQLTKAGFRPATKNRRPARNIILFIGDGLGVSGITATRKFKETFSGKPFYENSLVWDSFPFSGFSKTYELDNVVADSAGTATAYLSGVKTRYGFIGVDGSADLTCNTTKGHVESIAHWAARAGKVAGLVTTTAITHASPSPLYAHIPAPLRNFEYHGDDKRHFYENFPYCSDIAHQFVKNAQHIKVALGGGLGHFIPNNKTILGEYDLFGLRNDDRDLVGEWKADRSKGGRNDVKFVTSREELEKIDPDSVDYLLGLFSQSHMTFTDDHPPKNEPSLREMVQSAITILNRNKDGYFLFVEGGRIDHGHHMGTARYALSEGIEFDRAIKTALDMTDPSETLIVVTSDHSHTLSISGYLSHDSNILGLSVNLANDNKTFTALNYANGPGFNLTGESDPFTGSRRNTSEKDTVRVGYHQHAAVPMKSEGHGGEDVPVYANGIFSELFSGTFEQSYIAWAMGCAAGLYGPAGEAANQMAALCPDSYRAQRPTPEALSSLPSCAFRIGSCFLYSTLIKLASLLLFAIFLSN